MHAAHKPHVVKADELGAPGLTGLHLRAALAAGQALHNAHTLVDGSSQVLGRRSLKHWWFLTGVINRVCPLRGLFSRHQGVSHAAHPCINSDPQPQTSVGKGTEEVSDFVP